MESLNNSSAVLNASSPDSNDTGTYSGDCPNFANFPDPLDFNSDASSYVEFICYPFLLLFCTVGNGLSLFVFGSKGYATSVTVYLLALALSDFGVLWFYLHTYVVDVKAFHQDEIDPILRENALRTRVFDWLRDVCLQVSDWSLIAFSVERLCAIIRPLHFRNGFSWKTGLGVELVITFLAALFCLETLVTPYHFIARQSSFPRGTPMTEVVGSGIVKWHTMQNEAEVDMQIKPPAQTLRKALYCSQVIMILIKWAVLAVCHISLIIVIKKQMLSAPQKHKAANTSCHHQSQAVLMGAIVLYLVTNAPLLVLKCLVRASKPPYCSFFVTTALLQQMLPVANVVLLCNYSLNFAMYCLVSRQFRRLLKEKCSWLQVWLEKLCPAASSTMSENSSDMHLTPVETEVVMESSLMSNPLDSIEYPSSLPVRRGSIKMAPSSARRASLLARTDSMESSGIIEFLAKEHVT